ncbi:MAG: hypothetical protein WKF48_04355 [Solirubrobacteraceae bacterium]
MSGPRAGSGGPRAAPQRRAGAGRRGPGPARAAAPATPPGRRAVHDAARPGGVAVDGEAENKTAPVVEAEPVVASRELSGLALLLDQLDALLRDPTLARALSAFAAKLGASMRGLAAAIAGALRRLPDILLRLRLPRRLLLALLALTLPFAVAALLSAGGDERSGAGAGERSAQVQAQGAGGTSGAGVGMPRLSGAPERVRPVTVALVLDDTYDGARRARELRTLGTWLSENHAPGTRVTVIDAATGRASAALAAAQLGRARLTRAEESAPAAIGSALARRGGRQLLVTLGQTAPASDARTLSIVTRRRAPSDSTLTTRGTRSETTIDDRRPDAFAASVARGIMAMSGQTERP